MENKITETQTFSIEDIFQNPEIVKTAEDIKVDNLFKPDEEETPLPEEEKKPEEEKETPDPKTEIKSTPETTFYTDLIKDYIDEGEWEDVVLDINGEQIELSKLENVDKETFKRLQHTFKLEKQKKDKENFISTEGLNENTKKLIELAKKGEDITPLIKQEVDLAKFLETIDLDDETVQEQIVSEKLRSQGLKPAVIRAAIADLKAELKLDEEAREAIEGVKADHKLKIDNLLKEREEEIAAQVEDQKQNKKLLAETYTKFSLKDTVSKSLIDAAIKTDENGLTKTDKLFFAAKDNPEVWAKVNFLLNDPKGFEEFLGVKQKSESALKTITVVANTPKKSTPEKPAEEEKKDPWSDITVVG